MLTPAKEKTVREALGTKIATITGSTFVRRPMISSKSDWVTQLGVLNVDSEYELKLCTVDLVQFSDSEEEGCDDDPVVFLVYSAHLFHQYKEIRSNSSNSTDDFAAALLNLRNTFLQGSRDVIGVSGAEYLLLTQSGFIILGDDPWTEAYGHYVDLQFRVEVR